MMQIHERIKEERIKARLTEEEMAEKLHVKRPTYQYWEKKTPSIERIKQISKALGLGEDYFFIVNDEKDSSKRNETPDHNKYVSLLEKTHSDKDEMIKRLDADLIALRKAVDNIDVIDKRVSDIESTVSGFSGRLEDAEANVGDLREFVIRQLAKIRGESTAKVGAELGNVSVELLRKNQKKDIQHDSDK